MVSSIMAMSCSKSRRMATAILLKRDSVKDVAPAMEVFRAKELSTASAASIMTEKSAVIFTLSFICITASPKIKKS